MKLDNKEIVLGVTGGIACYKSLDIIRGIRDAGGNVTVIMTESAKEFIQPMTFQAISNRPVLSNLFSLEEESNIGHIKLAEIADAFLIAPATANIIAKATIGLADDLLSTTLLACKAPLFIAPAMNNHMWEHVTVQSNLNSLKQRGVHIIDPESGYLACGSIGPGRMAAPDKIVNIIKKSFENRSAPDIENNKPLKNTQVLITAGPTQERIDAVRYLTNDSSGKMGFALAKCCQEMGGDVCLISGPTAISPPSGIELVRIKSASEMHTAVMTRAENSKLIIKAAAVSDYRIDNPNPHKTKKMDTLTLNLVKNRDILKELGDKKKENQFLVGFAAESEKLEEYARGKLKNKNLDLIIGNNILAENSGFNTDTNKVMLINHSDVMELPLLSKEEVANRILTYILSTEKWQKSCSSTSTI